MAIVSISKDGTIKTTTNGVTTTKKPGESGYAAANQAAQASSGKTYEQLKASTAAKAEIDAKNFLYADDIVVI